MKCLETDPSRRPTARELLFHPALFEIPTLKLLSVHSLTDDIRKQKTKFSFFIIDNYKIGSKPDRSFVSPSHLSISTDQIFAELEPFREGSKPVIFT